MVERRGFDAGAAGVRAAGVATKPPMEAPPAGLPAPLASALGRRYDRLPVVAVRSRRGIRQLDRAESRWIRHVLRRYPLTDAAQLTVEQWWHAQIARACSGAAAMLERLETVGGTANLPPRPWRPAWLFQLWWNTLGPGARTWLRNRHSSFPKMTRGFCSRH